MTHEHVAAYPPTSPTLLQIWAAGSRSTAETSGTGAVARLHSALIAVLTHLLSRLYAAATQHEQIREVLLPLLLAALDENSPEHEVLLEDGLHLLQALLAGSSSINEGLQVRGLLWSRWCFWCCWGYSPPAAGAALPAPAASTMACRVTDLCDAVVAQENTALNAFVALMYW